MSGSIDRACNPLGDSMSRLKKSYLAEEIMTARKNIIERTIDSGERDRAGSQLYLKREYIGIPESTPFSNYRVRGTKSAKTRVKSQKNLP